MTILFLLPLITTALWYLGTRAVITQAIWSRYPLRVARFMDCAACAGFWWGVVAYSAMAWSNQAPYTKGYVLGIGFSSMIWTPLLAFLHDRAMYGLGSAIWEPPTGPQVIPVDDERDSKGEDEGAGNASPDE